jgi:hypothetical protein
MKLTIFFIYGFLFCLTFVIFAFIWHWQMAEVYFVSHQKGLITDFLPPFVQTGNSGDFYIKPRRVVYVIWTVYTACVVLIPAVCAWLLARMHQRALKQAWM